MSRRFELMPANMILVAIGVLDLLSTLVWLSAGHAIEVNPIMAALLAVGLPLFVAVKLCTLVAFVVVIEWYRRRKNPIFARQIGNITVAAYLGIYAISFCVVNHKFFLG